MHEVARAAARLHPSLTTNDLRGIEHCVAVFEARVAAIATLSPEDIQALAGEADRYAATGGAQNGPWNRHVQSVCAAHARACCCAAGQECYVNGPDTNTRELASAAIGSKAGQRERSFWERSAGRRHR